MTDRTSCSRRTAPRPFNDQSCSEEGEAFSFAAGNTIFDLCGPAALDVPFFGTLPGSIDLLFFRLSWTGWFDLASAQPARAASLSKSAARPARRLEDSESSLAPSSLERTRLSILSSFQNALTSCFISFCLAIAFCLVASDFRRPNLSTIGVQKAHVTSRAPNGALPAAMATTKIRPSQVLVGRIATAEIAPVAGRARLTFCEARTSVRGNHCSRQPGGECDASALLRSWPFDPTYLAARERDTRQRTRSPIVPVAPTLARKPCRPA
jgi:hypothetical protein